MWLIFIFFVPILSQGDVPAPNCEINSPRICLHSCFCLFCTQNQTLAEELLNGTISTDIMANNKHNDEGTCIDENKHCPESYYTVSSLDVVHINGGGCGYKVAGIMALVMAGLIVLAGIIMCVCNGYNRSRQDKPYAAV